MVGAATVLFSGGGNARSPAQDGFVEVEGAVGGGEDADVGILARAHAVPELHELRLERRRRLVLVHLARAQQRINLVCAHAQIIKIDYSIRMTVSVLQWLHL
jgi:hypothetical protein